MEAEAAVGAVRYGGGGSSGGGDWRQWQRGRSEAEVTNATAEAVAIEDGANGRQKRRWEQR